MQYLDDTDNMAAAQDLYGEYKARKRRPNDQLEQDLRAPREHKQFMEETTARNPIVGTAAMVMAPAYSAAKALGIHVGGTGETKASRASTDEIFAAGEGYVRGLKKYFKRGSK